VTDQLDPMAACPLIHTDWNPKLFQTYQ